MSFYEIPTNSRMWQVVVNSAKNDALTALYMRGKIKEVELYRKLWGSEMPVCDAIVGGMYSYGLVPDGYQVVETRVKTGFSSTYHAFLFNDSSGEIIDPTAAQFFNPNFNSPGSAVYRMQIKNPNGVIVRADLGLGILVTCINDVRGVRYLI